MSEGMSERRILIVGAGICGLAAAVELSRRGEHFVLVEKTGRVGGLSPTLHLAGEMFELGPHIYFDKDPDVSRFWTELVGEKLRAYERRTRLFYDGQYIKSPLSLLDTLTKLDPVTVARILLSFLVAKLRRREITNAADWVSANFGTELYERFFRVYNEKIWGLPSTRIAPDWAGQRIKSSLLTMVYKSLRRDPKFIVKSFAFPDGGSETIHAAQERLIRNDPRAELRLDTAPKRIVRDGHGFQVWFGENTPPERFTHVISTIHLSDLCALITYPDKDEALIDVALSRLVYRDLVLLNLVFDAQDFRNMDEHWIDIHDPSVRALRVTNFSNYGIKPRGHVEAVGIEYNCTAGDDVSRMTDGEILAQGLADLKRMKLTQAAPRASAVLRVSKAYPVYFKGYRAVVEPLFAELGKVEGLVLAGRNAMYKWNNMHHSVKTGLLAAQNVLGAHHDLTQVRGNVTIGKDTD